MKLYLNETKDFNYITYKDLLYWKDSSKVKLKKLLI